MTIYAISCNCICLAYYSKLELAQEAWYALRESNPDTKYEIESIEIREFYNGEFN